MIETPIFCAPLPFKWKKATPATHRHTHTTTRTYKDPFFPLLCLLLEKGKYMPCLCVVSKFYSKSRAHFLSHTRGDATEQNLSFLFPVGRMRFTMPIHFHRFAHTPNRTMHCSFISKQNPKRAHDNMLLSALM